MKFIVTTESAKTCTAKKNKNASTSQRLFDLVYDTSQVMSYSEVLLCMDMWEAASKEREKGSGVEVADATMACGWRKCVPADLCENLQKMSHVAVYSGVQKFIIDQVGVRMSHDVKHVEALPIQAGSNIRY